MSTHGLTQQLASEQGFSLIELMVALIAGIVVLFALFNIQDVTLHQTSRVFSKVDATQHARAAIEGLENELHSGCVADDVTPVQPGSTSTSLLFVSQYGAGATLTPVEHQITFSNGTLTDTIYQETGETTTASGLPEYLFSSTPFSSRTVLTDVSQSGSTPVFQYYAYQEPLNSNNQPYTNSAGEPYMMLLDGTSEVPGTSIIPTAAPLPDSPSLSSANAQDAAEVNITLSVGPSGGTEENTNLSDAADTVSDGVVLRLTPAANHAGDGNVFLPCQ